MITDFSTTVRNESPTKIRDKLDGNKIASGGCSDKMTVNATLTCLLRCDQWSYSRRRTSRAGIREMAKVYARNVKNQVHTALMQDPKFAEESGFNTYQNYLQSGGRVVPQPKKPSTAEKHKVYDSNSTTNPSA